MSKYQNKFFRNMTITMVCVAIFATFFIVLNILTGMIDKSKSSKKDNKSKEAFVNVSVKKMENETFIDELTLNAEVVNINGNIVVTSPITGTLESNLVRLGDEVIPGDILGVVNGTDVGVSYNPSNITSKIYGIVIGINANPGQKFAAGTSLYTIQSEPEYMLRTSVSERDASYLKVGSVGRFTTAGNPQKEYKATLRYVSPVVNSATRTVEIEAEVDKTDKDYSDLKAGNYVRFNLVKTNIENCLIIPNEALKTYAGKQSVFILDKNDIARRVFVDIKDSTETKSIISSGLKVGDSVIIQGKPIDGAKVKVLD